MFRSFCCILMLFCLVSFLVPQDAQYSMDSLLSRFVNIVLSTNNYNAYKASAQINEFIKSVLGRPIKFDIEIDTDFLYYKKLSGSFGTPHPFAGTEEVSLYKIYSGDWKRPFVGGIEKGLNILKYPINFGINSFDVSKIISLRYREIATSEEGDIISETYSKGKSKENSIDFLELVIFQKTDLMIKDLDRYDRININGIIRKFELSQEWLFMEIEVLSYKKINK